MKKCPYCAEEIQDAAIKCRYCGSMLTGAPGLPAAESAQSTARAVLYWVVLVLVGMAIWSLARTP